jgi:hypothetical protein
MERRRVGVAGVRASEDEGAAGGPHFAPAMPDAGGQASGRATAAAACGRPHLAVMASTGVAVEYASGVLQVLSQKMALRGGADLRLNRCDLATFPVSRHD